LGNQRGIHQEKNLSGNVKEFYGKAAGAVFFK
jgi:hypothetical protein